MNKINLEYRQLFVERFSRPTPALFLDRDGVVIEDCHYLSDPRHVRLCSGATNLLHHAKLTGWPVILVTNQSGISRGFFQWDDFVLVNNRMQELLGKDAPLSAIYANGYGPDCPKICWRKPRPEMLIEASKDLNIDLKKSILIGDRLSDLKAGEAAGLASLFHVLTGYGADARKSVESWHYGRSPSSPYVGYIDSLDCFPRDHIKTS